MPIDAFIRDPISENGLRVTAEGALGVVIHAHPPLTDAVVLQPFAGDFETGAGVTEMTVDGSAVSVDFSVGADATKTRYIKTIELIISDGSGPRLRDFGGGSALSVGLQFLWESQAGTTLEVGNVRSNFEALKLSAFQPAFGTGSAAFRLNDAIANNVDAYVAVIDMERTFGFPWGLPLIRGTLDRLTFRVRDDLTGVSSVTARGFGTQF
jgi:hypothetical protein